MYAVHPPQRHTGKRTQTGCRDQQRGYWHLFRAIEIKSEKEEGCRGGEEGEKRGREGGREGGWKRETDRHPSHQSIHRQTGPDQTKPDQDTEKEVIRIIFF